MNTHRYIAFEGTRRIAEGSLAAVAAATKAILDRGEAAPVLVFDARTSNPVEIDFRGSNSDVVARLTPDAPAPEPETRGPGRPKLGVVAREVTLLPRHWDWLRAQPGGASVALRKLVDQARHQSGDRDRARAAQEAAYRFMAALGGNLPDFEEAARALFAGDRETFSRRVASWPQDVRDHTIALAFADHEGVN
jgi:uncharacterized protein